MQAIPFIFLLPGDGSNCDPTDLDRRSVGCITSSLEDPKTRNKVYEIGGGEYLTYPGNRTNHQT